MTFDEQLDKLDGNINTEFFIKCNEHYGVKCVIWSRKQPVSLIREYKPDLWVWAGNQPHEACMLIHSGFMSLEDAKQRIRDEKANIVKCVIDNLL